jgi:hypothetical protein
VNQQHPELLLLLLAPAPGWKPTYSRNEIYPRNTEFNFIHSTDLRVLFLREDILMLQDLIN